MTALRPVVLALAIAGLIVSLSACGDGGAPSTAQGVAATQRPPTKGPEGGPGTEESLNTIGGLIAGEPLLPGDFADPFVLDQDRVAYVYATNTTDANLPVVRIDNYKEATYLGDGFPTIPSWTSKNFIWAPAVWARPDGQYVLYYAGLDNASNKSQRTWAEAFMRLPCRVVVARWAVHRRLVRSVRLSPRPGRSHRPGRGDRRGQALPALQERRELL